MSHLGKTVHQAVAPTKTALLTGLINEARGPDKRKRDEAFNELYTYVAGPMRGLIDGCVRRIPGGPFRVTDAMNDAVGVLFLNWSERKVHDTGHFRALVVQCVYWQVCNQRRANARLMEAVTDDFAGPPPSHDERNAQERFEAAVEALAEFERMKNAAAAGPEDTSLTPLADAVQARHLIGLSTASTGDAPQTQAPPHVPTFEAVGELLKIDTSTANKRYWQALEWLHNNFPDVVPKLPERKKSGRKKKAGNGNGGAE